MNLQSATDTLARLANQHQGLLDAYAALQELGGLASAKGELTNLVTALRADWAAAQSDLATAKKMVEDTTAKAAEINQQGLEQANQLVADAKAKALEIVAAADAEAALTKTAAAVMADQIAKDLTAQRSDLEERVADLTSQIATLEKQHADGQAALDDITARTAAVKASISQLIA